MLTTHAEINLLMSIENNIPKHMYVVSPYKHRFRNSRPCDNCIKMMLKFGVEYVTFSTGILSEPFRTEKVRHMKFLGKSRGDTN
jgi:hypothetical protein